MLRGGAAAQRQSIKENEQFVAGLICLFLALVVFIVFGRTLGYEFVNYDDPEYVYENPRIANGVSFGGIVWAFTHVHADNWHPLTTISHMLDCQIYGLQPWGHHFTNVILHATAAVLLFLALRKLTLALWPSAFVAAIFAIHPLRVGSVAWVSERKDVLSGVLFMLTLWAYARYARSARPSSGQLMWALFFFALGLLCKPTLVTLPFVLLLLDYWPLRRLRMESSKSRTSRPMRQAASGRVDTRAEGGQLDARSFGELLFEKIPFFALSALSCLATLLAQERSMIAIRQLTFPERVGNAMVAYVAYIGQMFWPADLAVVYPYPEGVNIALALLAFLVLLIVSTGLIIYRNKYPFLLVGWLWFLGVLVPMIGIVQVGAQARADRYTYLSQIGLYIAVAWGAVELLSRWPRGRSALIAVAAVILIALIADSSIQAASWRNSEMLWNQALAHTTNNHIAENNLGDALNKKGRWDESLVQVRKALKIYPEYPEANNNLGYVLAKKGNWAEAVTAYRAAIRNRPKYSKAHNNLAISLAEQGKTDEAMAEFREALRIDPNDPDTHSNLAILLLRTGRRDEGMAHLREALRLKPDDKEVRDQLYQLETAN